jgi:hypothetical protein
MGAPGSARPLSPDELELLQAVSARPFPGPLRRSAEKDRLRKLGLIEADRRDFREGQDFSWIVTEAGRRRLEAHRAAA